MSDMYTKQQNLDISEKRVHETDISIHEIERLTDLNKRLVAAAKELGYADDTHEWDDAWSKMCKLFKEC
jgi:coenzyme F420-reducing hydrogenase delta subunit